MSLHQTMSYTHIFCNFLILIIETTIEIQPRHRARVHEGIMPLFFVSCSCSCCELCREKRIGLCMDASSESDKDENRDETVHVNLKQNCYTILKESDIHQLQEERISLVSSILSLPKASASILLRHYFWNLDKVQDALVNESCALDSVGLSSLPVQKTIHEDLTCGICYQDTSAPFDSPSCGHIFCNECWESYISTSIEGGPRCLTLRCPEPACRVAVSPDMIKRLASNEDFEKYRRFVVSSYVECDPKTKWCPGPGCEYAVKFEDRKDGSCNYDVTCRCSYGFCWNCAEEAHRPVDCKTVKKWMSKCDSESDNMNMKWILAFTKPCPKCKKPIEKNQGCNHMTCRAPCYFQFCWLCLGDWIDHSCNGYRSKFDEERREAQDYLKKYSHYFERWATNRSSEKKARADFKKMEKESLEKLSRIQMLPVTRLNFITEAWEQIVKCRHILKWTYAFGYFLDEKEVAKKRFFEYLQGEAESALERLHRCAESDLQVYVDSEERSNDFIVFQMKLTKLTAVTGDFFENLVTALENGLSDVDCNNRPQKKRGTIIGE